MSATALLRSLVRNADALAQPGAYLLVRDGDVFTDLPESLPLTSGAEASVVRAGSELHLRHALWAASQRPLIALIPGDMPCPADLREQSVRHKVHTLNHTEVLQAVLGTRVIGLEDSDLHDLAVEYAEPIRQRLKLHTTPTVVDRALLERTLVEVVSELANLGLASGDLGPLVAQWAIHPPAWSPAVHKLARRVLAQQGPFGRIVAWALEQDNGCRDLVVYGAVLSAGDALPAGAWGPLDTIRTRHDDFRLDKTGARPHLVSLATDAIQHLGTAAEPLLDDADAVARRCVSDADLQTSNVLPLAFAVRAHQVAQALGRGEADVATPLRRLGEHILAPTRQAELDLLQEMARLARYLAVPRTALTSAQDVVHAYATDHAFADHCVRRIERSLAHTTTHRDAATALIDRVLAARDALNLDWARRLTGDYKRTLLSQDYPALPQLTRSQLSPTLPNHRVFLLVLDGCSVPVWLDLLKQLNDQPRPIGLERAHTAKPYALAPLPTITSHARGALFLGEIPKDPFAAETTFATEQERKTDPARFNQNQGLGSASRRLFLKGDLTDDSAALQAELGGDTRIVAAVYNAVDDRIGSHDTGQAWRMDVRDIRGLLPTLRAAFKAGRRVLVTADHGHSPFRGNSGYVGAGSTPRYATLNDGDAVPDGFIEVDCERLSGQDGRMAFAYKQGVYRGQQQVGFHGGCSLEEMVVPMAWLAESNTGVPKPPWWHTLVTEAPTAAPPRAPKASPPPTETRREPSAAPPPEPTAPPVAAPPASKPAPATDLPALPDALHALSPADQRLLAYVLQHGPVRTTDLARFASRPPNRMRGYLVQLTRKLVPLGASLNGTDLPDGEKQWTLELP